MSTLTAPLGLGFVGVQNRDSPGLWKLKDERGSQDYTAVPSKVPCSLCLHPVFVYFFTSSFPSEL